MFPESLYFWDIQNSTIIYATFPSILPLCNYTRLPSTVKMLETFMEAILCVVSCTVPVGNISWVLFQEGRSSNLRLRRGVRQGAHTRNNPHVKCTGVYCSQTVNNAVKREMYGVLLPWLGISLLTVTLIVQLRLKVLINGGDTSADCNWSTRHLNLHSWPHTLLAR